MNKICVIKPNGNSQYCKSLWEYRSLEPPIWQLILAKHYKTNLLIDAEVDNLSYEQIIDKALNQMKSDTVVLVASGSHPSAFIQMRDEINTLEKLFKDKAKIIIHNTLSVNPCDYKIDWSLIDVNKYRASNWHSFTNNLIASPYGVNYSSVDCPMKCNYCVIHEYYGNKYRVREIEDVIRDFDELAKRKVINIKMMDELFLANPKRLEKLCKAMIERKYNFNIWAYARVDIMNEKILKLMRKAGIRWLALGFESGNDEIRKRVLKGNFTKEKIKSVVKMIKDNDICVLGNFMFGFWEDNKDTMQETLDLAFDLNCEYVNFYCLTSFPGTPFYKELKEKGIKMPEKWSEYSQVSENFKSLPTRFLTAQEVLRFRDSAFQQFFRNDTYLNMIEKKFGDKVVGHIDKMIHQKLGRLYY